MKFMWMDLKLEKRYKDMFSAPVIPSCVVFNPHKRLRFTLMDHGEDNEKVADRDTVEALVDKVLGGDARFKNVPGQKLPVWSTRTDFWSEASASCQGEEKAMPVGHDALPKMVPSPEDYGDAMLLLAFASFLMLVVSLSLKSRWSKL